MQEEMLGKTKRTKGKKADKCIQKSKQALILW